MTLPGRLTVAFLDEDNPLKSFFRMKPLLTDAGEGFMLSETDDEFPEEGFIRIVPDKNEMTMFKIRMRQLGRYCTLDLRKHMNENDKIRPNKNYIFGGPEHSQFIVYSDVVGRVPPHLIAEVLLIDEEPVSEQLTANLPMPGTVYVVVKRGDEVSGPWSWSMDPDGHLALRHAENQPFSELSASIMDGKVISVPLPGGGEAALMYDLGAFELGELTVQEFERIVDSGLFGGPSLSASQAREQSGERPGVETYKGMEQTIAPELQAKAADAPWLSRSELLKPRAVSSRLSLRDQAIQAQTGINPRRGRSLHEVVDEQWRKSRYDQLGHPVPGQATGRPIASPIERATVTLSEAWSISEARNQLLTEMLKIDELREAIVERLEIGPATFEADEKLDELEARRLALLGEIDAIKRRREEAKLGLMDELMRANATEIDAHKQRLDALKEELRANERAAEAARETAKLAQQLLSEEVSRLDERLGSALLIERMSALGSVADNKPGIKTHPETYEPSAGALITDVRTHMARGGFELSNDEAVNLLACMMAGGTLILSGPSGSGKTEMARKLAGALGLGGGANRFAQVHEATDPAVQALMAKSDGITPLMLLIDDFNTGNCQQRMIDVMALQESAIDSGTPLCLILTAQDAPEGLPLPARLLGRSFLVRLKGATAATAWKLSVPDASGSRPAVSLDALKRIFRPSEDLPPQITERLDKLRGALDAFHCALDHRTLNALWTYCASARGMMQCSAHELLDMALSQRAIPSLLASMEIDALRELPKLIVDMPRSLALMDQPLPLPPL